MHENKAENQPDLAWKYFLLLFFVSELSSVFPPNLPQLHVEHRTVKELFHYKHFQSPFHQVLSKQLFQTQIIHNHEQCVGNDDAVFTGLLSKLLSCSFFSSLFVINPLR